MQVQRISNNNNNNNYNSSFRQKLVFDIKLITRATSEEKSDLAKLKRMFKNDGIKGKIKVKNNNRLSVGDIICDLRKRYYGFEFENEAPISN